MSSMLQEFRDFCNFDIKGKHRDSPCFQTSDFRLTHFLRLIVTDYNLGKLWLASYKSNQIQFVFFKEVNRSFLIFHRIDSEFFEE